MLVLVVNHVIVILRDHTMHSVIIMLECALANLVLLEECVIDVPADTMDFHIPVVVVCITVFVCILFYLVPFLSLVD